MKILFSLFIVLVSFFLMLFIGVVLALPFWGMDLLNMDQAPTDSFSPDKVNQLKYLQSIFSLGIFIIPPFVISWLIVRNTTQYLYFNKVKNTGLLLLGGIIMIAALPAINFLAEWNASLSLPDFMKGLENKMQSAEQSAGVITEAFLKVDTIKGLLINLFVMAVIPAFGEELLFRGVLQRLFVEWTKSVHWGIIISAVLFSTFHFQFYGFIPRMVLGVVLGYMLVYGQSLWYPVFAHFVNNAFAVILSYFYIGTGSYEQMEEFGSSQDTYLYLILGLIMVGLMIFYFIRGADTNGIDKYRNNVLKKPGNLHFEN